MKMVRNSWIQEIFQGETTGISDRLDLGAEGKRKIKVDSNFEPEQLRGKFGRRTGFRVKESRVSFWIYYIWSVQAIRSDRQL